MSDSVSVARGPRERERERERCFDCDLQMECLGQTLQLVEWIVSRGLWNVECEKWNEALG